MSLDIAVLEDVRRNLVSSQDMYERNIVREIQKLDERELRGLRILCWPGAGRNP